MKVYDCCIAFNEPDLLEVRFAELYDAVHAFVVVEGTTTHAGVRRESFLPLNDVRYDPWRDKIRRVVVDLPLPEHDNDSSRKFVEVTQRNMIVRGLHDADPGDAFTVTDADEIIRASSLRLGASVLAEHPDWRVRFFQARYQGYVNIFETDGWGGANMATVGSGYSPQDVRASDTIPTFTMHGAGWHFNAVGGPEVTAEKMTHWCHAKYSVPEYADADRIAARLAKHEDLYGKEDVRLQRVDPDWSFPAHLLRNRERFAHLIREEDNENRAADGVPRP